MPYDTGVSSSIDSAAQIQAQAQAEAERLKQQAQQTYFGAPNPQAPGQWGYTTGAPSSTPVQNPPTKVNPLQPSGYLRPIPASPANAIAPDPYLAPYARTPAQLPAPLPGGKRLFTPPLESAQFTTLSTPRIAPPVTPEVSGGSYLQTRASLGPPSAEQFGVTGDRYSGSYLQSASPEKGLPGSSRVPAGTTLSLKDAAEAYRAAQNPSLPQAERDNAMNNYRNAVRAQNPVESMAEWNNRMALRTDYDRFLGERGITPSKSGAGRLAAEEAQLGEIERKQERGEALNPTEVAALNADQIRKEKYKRVPAIGPGTITDEAMRNLNRYSAEYGQLNREMEILREKRDTAGMKAKQAEIEDYKNQTGVSRGFDSAMKNEIARLQGRREEVQRMQRMGTYTDPRAKESARRLETVGQRYDAEKQAYNEAQAVNVPAERKSAEQEPEKELTRAEKDRLERERKRKAKG